MYDIRVNIKLLVRMIVLVGLCWLVVAQTVLGDDFDSQVRCLLQTQMLTSSEIFRLSTVFQTLQNTLQKLWPGCKVIPLGSLTTGMATKTSDTDCVVQIPHINIYNETTSKYLILQAVRLLEREPKFYGQVRPKFRANNKVSLLKFNYKPTQKNCDVNFINTVGVEISRVLASYYSLMDDRALKLTTIVKLWSKVHQMNDIGMITSLTLDLMIVFYLQQLDTLPSYHVLRTFNDFEMCPKKMENSLSVYQLLGGFFKYYSKFNYEEYIVSPLWGYPMSKMLFGTTCTIRDEALWNKNYIRNVNSEQVNLTTALYVQDILEPHTCTNQDVSPHRGKEFILHVNYAARMYRILHRDNFLKALLKSNRHEETSIKNNNILCN